MDIRLDGKNAVITGGSKGLGLAIAKEMAASGANVAILARDAETLEAARAEIVSTTNGKVVAVSCDVSKADSIEAAMAQVAAELGPVDILVNNAGQAAGQAFETIPDSQWQYDLDLKVFAAIRTTRLVWEGMRQRKWGRVINVLAISAKVPGARSAPSSVSRAAGMALSKIMAAEGAPHGILVNSLLVGQIESDQLARGYKARGGDGSYEDFLAQAGSRLPMGRVGKSEEFAAIACFLASDRAGYLTGDAINVDGGLSPAP
jgi:NAD(P)-dependent dehydrogenase (short-subunit alcohol dehydrogenase family)